MMQVEQIAIERLIPYAKNARTHSDAQVAQIAASIREFGFCNPVLIDGEDGIIAGHGRVMAARQLGLVEIPCVRLGHLTDTQRRAYILADNRLAMSAGWDDAMLALELSALRIDGFDMELTGFDSGEIDALLDGADDEGGGESEPPECGGAGSLAARFGIPPFSVLNAREGWWQDRKRAWLALGIHSELGRGGANECAPGGGGGIWGHAGPSDFYKRVANATPGGSLMPAMDYSKRQRGDGAGRPIASNEP